MIELQRIFNVVYGNGLSLNSLERNARGINFVARSSTNNGVVSRINKIMEINPFQAGTITVALSGSVLESFVQPEPFYTSFHVFCLSPIEEMSLNEKLYYCMCIKNNKYRYNYGRQANRTLKNILVPSRSEIPTWVYDNNSFEQYVNSSASTALAPLSKPASPIRRQTYDSNLIPLSALFEVIYGSNLELNKLKREDDGVNFVSRSSKNNGVSAKVKRLASLDPIPAGMLTVAAGGSVLESFVQLDPFYSGRDLYYLNPKDNLTIYEKLYYCLCIRANKYKYNYGRQANRTLKDILIPAPNSIPGWVNNINIDGDLDISRLRWTGE